MGEAARPRDRAASAGSPGLCPSRRELGIRYWTSWEINQIYWGPALGKTWWHLMGSMEIGEALEALDGRVPRERIVESETEPPP